MATPTPDQRPEGWDRAATAYERVITRLTGPFAEEALARLDLKPGERLLDVACGPGTASFQAASRGASVMATDYAPGMIARLLERRERDGVDNLEAAVMDGQALDLPDDSFDAAVSVFGFMFFLDQDAGLRELHRVLRAEGRAAIVTWGPPERNPGITIQREAVVAAVPDLPEPPGPPAIFSLSDPQAMEARMRAAGFEEAHAEPVAREWTFDSAEDLWALREASPVFEGLADVIGDRWESVHQELIRLVDARFGGGPVMFRAEALLTTGRRP